MLNPRVTVNQGVLEGLSAVTANGKSFFSFRGIPYAEPPIGDLRFKPPIICSPWNGVKDATKDGNQCVQFDIITKKLVGSEDCLYLNVYTPNLPETNTHEALLPVVVFIHGGGFGQGSGRHECFHPDFIIEKDIIIVTINFRLGPLGFLCLHIPEAPGNIGLRDQNLALKWVKGNINFFKGDQNNVTLYGISSGAASVENHLLSTMSKGLFHKSIIQSGSALNPWALTKDPLQVVEKLMKLQNVKMSDPKEVLIYLKNMDAYILVRACAALFDKTCLKLGEFCVFGPVVEKDFDGIQPFMNKKPLELIRSGSFTKVPTIIGICENEGELYINTYESIFGKLAEQNLLNYMPQSFEVDRTKYDRIIKDLYTTSENDENSHVKDFLSDMLFLSGIRYSLKIRNQHTHETQNYLFLFTYMGNLNTFRSSLKYTKPVHADDLGYITFCRQNNKAIASPEDKVIRNRMVKMWTDFAKTGNPTPEQTTLIKEKWLPLENGCEMNLMEIGRELKMTTMPWKARTDMWDDLYTNLK